MIYYFLHQGSYVIVGSNVGSDRHPAWYLNLQADPAAEIQIGRERKKVVARTAEGEDRERLWSEIVEKDPSYAEYQSRTDRQIPVFCWQPSLFPSPETAINLRIAPKADSEVQGVQVYQAL